MNPYFEPCAPPQLLAALRAKADTLEPTDPLVIEYVLAHLRGDRSWWLGLPVPASLRGENFLVHVNIALSDLMHEIADSSKPLPRHLRLSTRLLSRPVFIAVAKIVRPILQAERKTVRR